VQPGFGGCRSPYNLLNVVTYFSSATRSRNFDCDPRIPRDHLAFCRKYPTGTCVAGNGGAPSSRDNITVRHEVAIITVEPASAGLHPLFHQRFPTDTCWIGNDPVRSCRNNVTPPNGGHQPARRDGDYQPQGGRGLGMDRMVKTSESPYTRRHVRTAQEAETL